MAFPAAKLLARICGRRLPADFRRETPVKFTVPVQIPWPRPPAASGWADAGAGLFTLAALEAVGGPAARCRVNHIVIIVRVPVVVELLGVHGGEEIRDGDVFGAAVSAVPAGGAWDQLLAAEDLLHLLHRRQLCFVQGLKSRMKARLSSICCKLLMPERTIIMPGKPAAKRMA